MGIGVSHRVCNFALQNLSFMAKIIYLHDPEVESHLPMLETLFPTVEIITPALDEDPIKSADNLIQICKSFKYEPYVIITDGICVLFASYFINVCKRTDIPMGIYAINPNLESYKSSKIFSQLLQQAQILCKGEYEKHKPEFFSECWRCFFIFDLANVELYTNLLYNKKNSNCILSKNLGLSLQLIFEKSCQGWVDINYLQRAVLTPKNQIIPVNTALISVDGEFTFYGETISISRIPKSAFWGRKQSVHMPSILSLLPGDIIEDGLDDYTESGSFELLNNGMFKDTTTGELKTGLRAPFAGWRFKGILPDWSKRWTLSSKVHYKVCMTFGYVRAGHIGYDKYGNQYKILDKGELSSLMAQFPSAMSNKKGNDSTQFIVCYAIDNPDKIVLFPYGFDGIMVFKRPANALYCIALKLNIVQKDKSGKQHANDSESNS